jgi:hypothetical protein
MVSIKTILIIYNRLAMKYFHKRLDLKTFEKALCIESKFTLMVNFKLRIKLLLQLLALHTKLTILIIDYLLSNKYLINIIKLI